MPALQMKRQSRKPVGRRGICDRCGKVFYGSVFLYLCPACRELALEEIRERERIEAEEREKEEKQWAFLNSGPCNIRRHKPTRGR